MHRLLLLCLLLLSAPPAAAAPSGRALNTQGFRLYQAGKYPQALAKFTAAAEADPQLALAHYNVAATLGVLRKKGLICEYSAHRETIVARLERAVRLDPRRLARARVDADLDVIRDTVGWQRLLGRSPENDADLPELLRRVTFYYQSQGDLDARRVLTFPDARRVVLDQTEYNPDTNRVVQTKKTGTYTLQGRTLRLSFPKQAPLEGKVASGGGLEFGAPLGTFVDTPAECDA